MMLPQFGSFEIKSAVMKNLINSLANKKDKKFFLIVGDSGSGKSTMARYINQIIFSSAEKNIFEATMPPDLNVLESAIICTSKENAYEIIKNSKNKDLCILELPNLSERKADIAPFALFFLDVLALMNNRAACKLSEKALEKLLQHSWPGNFHELESVLEEAFERSQADNSKFQIEPEHIDLKLSSQDLEFTIGQKLDEVERKYILQTLYFVHQNRTKAAEILGISIRTLRNKINQYREEGYL